jgi:protein arginine kinase
VIEFTRMSVKDSQVNIEELAISEGIWHTEASDPSDIVLKSVIRYVRNVKGYKFAHRMDKEEKAHLSKILIEQIMRTGVCNGFSVYALDSISEDERNIFLERNILNTDSGREGTLLISDQQDCSFLLCDCDHILFIAARSGYDFHDIYKFGKTIIQNLDREIDFSFSESFGYLTADPHQSGAGVQFSLTVHLPGLFSSGKMNDNAVQLEKEGIGLRSSWIDGYYEIYNKYSMGMNEKMIYNNSTATFERIIQLEKENRENRFDKNKNLIEDKAWRSYGILLSSRLISLYEAFDLLSNLRLGISLGIISYLTIKDINLLLYYIQDFHLKKRYTIGDSTVNMDEVRAKFLRDYLKEVI